MCSVRASNASRVSQNSASCPSNSLKFNQYLRAIDRSITIRSAQCERAALSAACGTLERLQPVIPLLDELQACAIERHLLGLLPQNLAFTLELRQLITKLALLLLQLHRESSEPASQQAGSNRRCKSVRAHTIVCAHARPYTCDLELHLLLGHESRVRMQALLLELLHEALVALELPLRLRHVSYQLRLDLSRALATQRQIDANHIARLHKHAHQSASLVVNALSMAVVVAYHFAQLSIQE